MFIIINSVFWSVIIIAFSDTLVSPFVQGVEFYPYILLGILTVVFNPIFTIFQSMLQTMEKAKEFSRLTILNSLLLMSLNIILIVIFKLGAFGQLLSALITSMTFGIAVVFILLRRKYIIFRFNKEYLKEALSYSLPLIPHLMSSSVANFFSRILLNNIVSTASAGIFNIASQLMLIIDTAHFSINSAYIPWFYGLMEKEIEERKPIIS